MTNRKALREAILKQAGWNEVRPCKWAHPSTIAKPWHLHTHEEKIAKFQRFCRYCEKPYVEHGALWLHEQKCPKKLQCMSCGKRSKPEDANNLHCPYCGGKLIEVRQ